MARMYTSPQPGPQPISCMYTSRLCACVWSGQHLAAVGVGSAVGYAGQGMGMGGVHGLGVAAVGAACMHGTGECMH